MSTPLRWDNVGGPSATASNLLNIAGTDNAGGGIEDIAKGLTGFNDFLTNKKTSRIALAIQQMQDRDTLNADAAAAIAGGDPRFMNNERLAEVLAKREVSLQERDQVDLNMDSTRLGMDSTRLDMRATRQDMGTQELEDGRRRFEAGTRQELHDLEVQRLKLGLDKDQNVVEEGDIKLGNLGERLDAGQAQTEAQTQESIGRNRRAERTSEDFFVQRALKLDQDRQVAEINARFPGNTKKAQAQRTAESMRLGIPLNRKNTAEADLDISLGTKARRDEAIRQMKRNEIQIEKRADQGYETMLDIALEKAKARLKPENVDPLVLPSRGIDLGQKHFDERLGDVNSPNILQFSSFFKGLTSLDYFTRQRIGDMQKKVIDVITPAEFEGLMDEVNDKWDSYDADAEKALEKRVNDIASKRRRAPLKK